MKKSKNGKRQVMDELVKKAIAARDAEVESAKKELYSTPKIPGMNRVAIRKIVKRKAGIK